MKNLLKLLGIIALAAVIGFTMGCKQDEDEDDKDKDKGNGLQWPADLTPDENALTGEKTGSWRTGSGTSGNLLSFSYLENGQAYVRIAKYATAANSTKEYFHLVKVEGKTLTVKGPETNNGYHAIAAGVEVVLCTDYTVTGGNKLTLTGSAISVGEAETRTDLSDQEFTKY